MALGARKFYKLYSLDGVFIHDTSSGNDVYDTSVNGFESDFLTDYNGKIDEHTILFISVSQEDVGRYVYTVSREYDDDEYTDTPHLHILNLGDTMVWARGNIYCVSTKSILDISFDENTNKLHVEYSDGTSQDIGKGAVGYSGIYPVKVDGMEISLENILFDEDGNFILNSDDNDMDSDLNNVHVEGTGNYASASYQHIEGKYAEVDGKYIFVIGYGQDDNNRYNLFTIDFEGTIFSPKDVIAGGTQENPNFRLSDIHSVLDVDWSYFGQAYQDFENQSFDNDYQ